MVTGCLVNSWQYYNEEYNEKRTMFSRVYSTREDEKKKEWSVDVVYIQIEYVESSSRAIVSVSPIMNRPTQKVIYDAFDNIVIENIDSVGKIFKIFESIEPSEFQIGVDILKHAVTISDKCFTTVRVAEDMSHNSYTSSLYISDGVKQYLIPSSSFDCEKMVVECADLNGTGLGTALLKYENLKDIV